MIYCPISNELCMMFICFKRTLVKNTCDEELDEKLNIPSVRGVRRVKQFPPYVQYINTSNIPRWCAGVVHTA